MTNDSTRIATILKDAFAAVTEAGIPPELQSTALEKAVDLLAGASGDAPSGPPPAGGGKKRTNTRGDKSVLDNIAVALKVDRDVIDEVFDDDESDGLKIVLGTGKFEAAKRGGTKQLALLLAAGRQTAGLEEWTPTKAIIGVVKDFNRFDSANFAYTIKQMDDVFLFSGSSSGDRKVKVNRQGKEQAATLIRALAGGDGGG
jgi:hypothetical protein